MNKAGCFDRDGWWREIRSMQWKQRGIPRSVRLGGAFQFLSGLKCQSYVRSAPRIDSLLFCFAGSVRPVLLVVFRLSGSLYLSPRCPSLVSL